ncbi:citrate synthase family protein [Ideonella livida]|uniref:citrate synthase (unknown stereospecificity) n=1 Tax=Ideonella livida TaxID=2707176 RepID=A0A7C9PFM2_9BURK|nr:citrate synthase family protein [Ideonella livida]NDY89854.1 helix-turn-helix domain-containing protein [Ideonella livida]
MTQDLPTADAPLWWTADQAAAHLGVRRTSLYSYVSRGLLPAHPLPGGRGKRYRADDVRRLAAQRRQARGGPQVAGAALDWGQPVLSSALSHLWQGRLHYRDQDAVAWSQTASLEDTAQLLWGEAVASPGPSATPDDGPSASAPLLSCTPAQALQAVQRALGGQPPDLTGWPLVRQVAQALLAAGAPPAAPPPPTGLPDGPLHLALAARWGVPSQPGWAGHLRQALVLCADHELNASTFVARCAAATGAPEAACVAAALATLTGPRHGGATALIEADWDRWLQAAQGTARALAAVVRQLLADRGPLAAGCVAFGHVLYPQGDPRAAALLAALPADPALDRLLAEVVRQSGLAPSLDFALVALRRALGLPRGAAFQLFALGRTVGWIAHAREQRHSGGFIRPRARYVGPLPAPAAAAAGPAAPPKGRVVRCVGPGRR